MHMQLHICRAVPVQLLPKLPWQPCYMTHTPHTTHHTHAHTHAHTHTHTHIYGSGELLAPPLLHFLPALTFVVVGDLITVDL